MQKAAIILSLLLSTAAGASTSAVESQSTTVAGSPTEQQLPQDRVSKLSYTAQDINAPVAERVAALHELVDFPGQNSLVAVARGVRSEHAEIRIASVAASAPYQLDYRWRLISPLLVDESKEVRSAAAVNLAKEFSKLEESEQGQLIEPLEDVKKELALKATSEDKLLLANIHRWLGEWQQAEKYYQDIIATTDEISPELWLNYADNFRAQSKEQEALNILEQGLKLHPSNANLNYSKALTLVRMDKKADAALVMNKAATLADDNSYFWYLNGVLQEPLDIELSVSSFERAYLISGNPQQLYALCDIYMKSNNEKSAACMAELKRTAPAYVIEQLEQKYQIH